ncbi:MAG: TlpA disulfide reductase family protein [Nonlabens sp.]
MKKIITILLCALVLYSCKEKDYEEIETARVNADAPLEKLDNFIDWWTYHNNNVNLSKEFVALDEDGEELSKREFLSDLVSGKFIPFKTRLDSDQLTYQLFNLRETDSKDIQSAIRNEGMTFLHYNLLEGTAFPEIDFSTINGDQITIDSLNGKTTVFKTWFIRCQACIEEFPVLNEFVASQENNPNIQFISLATDTDQELRDFLQDREFKYETVGRQTELIRNKLGITASPTHIVVGPDQKIKKVVNKAERLIEYLEGIESLGS